MTLIIIAHKNLVIAIITVQRIVYAKSVTPRHAAHARCLLLSLMHFHYFLELLLLTLLPMVMLIVQLTFFLTTVSILNQLIFHSTH